MGYYYVSSLDGIRRVIAGLNASMVRLLVEATAKHRLDMLKIQGYAYGELRLGKYGHKD